MNYKISEIFYSIQSEGFFAGTPATFIRFFGCNLDCSFCDEPLHKEYKENHTLDDILAKVNSECKHIVITGGEPTLYDLNELISKLQERGHFVQIESNGLNLKKVRNSDYITVSPKQEIKIDDNIKEYKFIIDKKTDIKDIIELSKIKTVYIQPMADMDEINYNNVKYCIEIIKENPTLKLSMQTHKILRIR